MHTYFFRQEYVPGKELLPTLDSLSEEVRARYPLFPSRQPTQEEQQPPAAPDSAAPSVAPAAAPMPAAASPGAPTAAPTTPTAPTAPTAPTDPPMPPPPGDPRSAKKQKKSNTDDTLLRAEVDRLGKELQASLARIAELERWRETVMELLKRPATSAAM